MSRRIHRKIPSPAPIAAAIEVARSGKKFRLPHNPRVTSITHDIIKYQEKHRYLQEQLLTQYQWLLSSGIPIPRDLLLSLQEQLSYKFSYTPSNVLTTSHVTASAQLAYNQQQQLQQRLFNFHCASLNDISSQIYHQQQLINCIHQVTCHPQIQCQFDLINPTVCLHGDALHVASTSLTSVSNSNSNYNKRGLPEPKCQCSLKLSPMHQLHHHQQHSHPHHQSSSSSQSASSHLSSSINCLSKETGAKVTSSVQQTSIVSSSSAPSTMKPALSSKSRTVNPPNSIMPVSASTDAPDGTGGKLNTLLPCTLQKVVKFNLNPTYSKGEHSSYDDHTRGHVSNSYSPSSSLHHQHSLASSICKSLTSGMVNAQIANRNRLRNFARTQSWERVASIETGVDLDPDVLNRNKRNLPLVPSFKHPTSPTMPMAKMKLIKDMITSSDLNFRRKMQVSPVPRYNLEHELKFGPKSSTYINDTLSAAAAASTSDNCKYFLRQTSTPPSVDQPFHFAPSNTTKQPQGGQSGQSNQSTRPSTPTYLMHDHSHHLPGHHSHHIHLSHHIHPQANVTQSSGHHLHSNVHHQPTSHLMSHNVPLGHQSGHHLRRPRSSIFSSLPGSPVHGYSRNPLFTFNNWRDDSYLPTNTSDREGHLRSAGVGVAGTEGHCASCCPCCVNGEVCSDSNCQCCNPYPGLPGLPSATGQPHASSVPDLRSTRLPSHTYIPSTVPSTTATGRHGHISGSHMYHHLYSRHSSPPPPPHISTTLHCDTCTNNQLTNCTHHTSNASVDSAKQFPSVSEITKPPFLDPTYNLIDKYDYNYDNYFKSKREKLFRPFFRSAPPSRSVTPDGLTVMSNYLTTSSTPVPQLINNLSSSVSGIHKGGSGTIINPSSSATISCTGSTSIVPAIANNKELIDSPKVVFKNQLKYFVEERKNALAANSHSNGGCCPSHQSEYYTSDPSANVGGSESNINALLNMYSNPPDPVKSKFPPAGASTYQSVPQGCIDPSSVTCFTPAPLLHQKHQQQQQQHNSLIGRRHSFNGPLGVGTSANSSSSNYLPHHHSSYRPSPSPYPSFYSSYEPPSASSLLKSTAAAVTAGTQRLISSSNPNLPISTASGTLSRLGMLNASGLPMVGGDNYPLSDDRYGHLSSDVYATSKLHQRSSSPYPGQQQQQSTGVSSHFDHQYSPYTQGACVNCGDGQSSTSLHHLHHHPHGHGHHHHTASHQSTLHHHQYHTSPMHQSSIHLPSHNMPSSCIDHGYNKTCINCSSGSTNQYNHSHIYPSHHVSPQNLHSLHHESSNLSQPYTSYPGGSNGTSQQHSTNLKMSKYL